MLHALAALALFAAADWGPTDAVGYWLTEDGDTVDVFACEDSICGRVVASPDIDPDGPPVVDENNPDPALRDRKILGLIFIEGFKETKKGWRKGTIYDPRKGETYRSAITRTGPEELKVKGCVGPICRTLTWTATDAPAE
ncbi:MAG: DUF2147 domain-containing protein [Pseudomonadota bacterium]